MSTVSLVVAVLLTANSEAARLNAEGVAAAASGRVRDALTSFERAFKLEPTNAEVVFNLARARESAGQSQAAIDSYERYVILAPSANDIAAVEQKIAQLRTAQIIVPEAAIQHALVGQGFVRAGQFSDAEREFKRAEALSPEWPAIHFNLGTLYDAQGHKRQAMEHFRRYLPFASKPELVVIKPKLAAWAAAEAEHQRTRAEAEQHAAATQRFQISVQTVFDKKTRLNWQREVSKSPEIWDAAMNYCSSLQLGGERWRLPTREELQSIADKSATPTIDPVAFPECPTTYFWSSSPMASVSNYAWVVYFGNGAPLTREVVRAYQVRCVR